MSPEVSRLAPEKRGLKRQCLASRWYGCGSFALGPGEEGTETHHPESDHRQPSRVSRLAPEKRGLKLLGMAGLVIAQNVSRLAPEKRGLKLMHPYVEYDLMKFRAWPRRRGD